ncbi:hypothetical protein R5H32_10850 [Defluviimonas sp. D31]|uniref:hypothetical protein n=1 Tax=Defluviimonas sp. D31 TaxID=3083253 RepID=UPI00296F6C0B|nr:hypothetical protein [Defluviimonas sp. D31]MDW4549852.1 hypothetical protein [Defluviimonas sp. D31]
MTDLTEKARVGRANALFSLSNFRRSGAVDTRLRTQARHISVSFVSTRSRMPVDALLT